MSKDDMIKVLEKIELAARRCGAFWPALDSLSIELANMVRELRDEQ